MFGDEKREDPVTGVLGRKIVEGPYVITDLNEHSFQAYFSGTFDASMPVCLNCKNTNRTKKYCRSRHAHGEVPWNTSLIHLSKVERGTMEQSSGGAGGADTGTTTTQTASGKNASKNASKNEIVSSVSLSVTCASITLYEVFRSNDGLRDMVNEFELGITKESVALKKCLKGDGVAKVVVRSKGGKRAGTPKGGGKRRKGEEEEAGGCDVGGDMSNPYAYAGGWEAGMTGFNGYVREHVEFANAMSCQPERSEHVEFARRDVLSTRAYAS